jgi:plasmid stability protein
MERTTVYLDPGLKRRLKEAAVRRGRSEAALLREALEAYLSGDHGRRVRPVGASRDGGIAHRVDEALDDLGFGRR